MNCDRLPSVSPKRDIAADVLKCICCVCVIVIHTASQSISSLRIDDPNWFCALFWGTLCRFAVPIFFMVSGALLLPPEKKISTWRIYEHYFFRILVCLLFWALMYELYFIAGYWILYRQFEAVWFWDAIMNVLTFNHHFHLYYLQVLLVFYVLLPVLRGFVAGADRSTLRYVLGVWFALGIILPYVFTFEPFSELEGILSEYPISLTYASLGYGLLGYYLKTADIRREHLKYFVIVFIVGFLGIYVPTVIVSHVQDSNYLGLLDAFTPPVVILSVGIYGIVTALCRDKTEADMPFAVWMSKASFCVYLVHHFFVMLIRTYLYTAYRTLCILTIPGLAFVVLLASLLVYIILKRIPWVNKHLI